MALISSRLVVAAVVTRLGTGSGFTAYLSVGPTPPADRTCVVHPYPADPDGVLGDPDRNAAVEFQTTSIASTSELALWTHDQVVSHLNRQVLSGSGFTTYPVRMVPGSQQPVRRDDELADPLYVVTCNWTTTAQPA